MNLFSKPILSILILAIITIVEVGLFLIAFDNPLKSPPFPASGWSHSLPVMKIDITAALNSQPKEVRTLTTFSIKSLSAAVLHSFLGALYIEFKGYNINDEIEVKGTIVAIGKEGTQPSSDGAALTFPVMGIADGGYVAIVDLNRQSPNEYEKLSVGDTIIIRGMLGTFVNCAKTAPSVSTIMIVVSYSDSQKIMCQSFILSCRKI